MKRALNFLPGLKTPDPFPSLANVYAALDIHQEYKMSMIRKYHTHKPHTSPWHRDIEPHNNHESPGRQTKQSN